jgi:subtilisin-like proprotein convertase family protein
MRILKSTLKGLALMFLLLTVNMLSAQVNVTMNWTAGAFATEPGWEVVNTATNVSVFCKASGAAFPNGATVLSLAPGTYQVRQFDSFGDGWNGGVLSFSKAACNLALGTYTGPPNAGFNPGANVCPGPSPVNNVSSNVAAATFTVVADNLATCVLTAPASVTVNSIAGVCGANVVLPIATTTCSGMNVVQQLNQNFSGAALPAGWSLIGTFPAAALTFPTGTANKSAVAVLNNAAFTGNHMRLDDDILGPGVTLNGAVQTNVINIPAGATSPEFKFDYNFDEAFGAPLEAADVKISLNSGAFLSIAGFPKTADAVGSVTVALPPGTISIQIQFGYNDGSDWGWSFDIDNVIVQATITGPPPITNNVNGGGSNASGIFPVGITPITFTTMTSVPAGAGQCTSVTLTGTTNVTVIDVEPPVTANCPANITVNLLPSECNKIVNWTVPTFTDNCVPNPPVAIASNGGAAAALSGGTGSGQAVLFYDIKNTNLYPISLTSVDVFKRAASTYNIWRTTTATTYVGNEALAASWTNIGTGTIVAGGIGLGNVPVNANSLILQPGQSVGICVQATAQIAGGPQVAGLSGLVGNTYTGPQRRVLGGVEFTYGILTNLAGGAAFSPANGNFGQVAGFPSPSYSAFVGTMNWITLPIIPVATSTPLNGAVPFKPGDTFVSGTTNISYTATDAAGNTAVCSFDVVVVPSLLATQTLACQDLVNLSTNAACTATITPAQILKGGPFQCLDNYIVEVYNGTNLITKSTPTVPASVGSAWVGQQLTVKVFDAINTNNYCWANVLLEDKLPPVITCPAAIVIDDCSVDIATATVLPTTLINAAPAVALAPANPANQVITIPVVSPSPTSVVQGLKVNLNYTTVGAGTGWIGDLTIRLTHPDGTVVILTQTAGGGGCTTQGNYIQSFTDAATVGPLNATFACGTAASMSGTFRPVGSFATLLGKPLAGNWTIAVTDAFGDGILNIPANGFSIEIATTAPAASATAIDGCAGVLVPVETKQIIELPCGNPLLRTIKRTFKATDNFGNTATCVQNINFRRPTLATITFPASVNLDCTYDNFKADPANAAAVALLPAILAVPATNTTWFDAAGNPAPSVTGRPKPSGGSCSGIVVDYQDMRLNDICGTGSGYTIMRTWKVYDACANAMRTSAQQVTVKDVTAPVIKANAGTIIASTTATSCSATVKIANPSITDNCTPLNQIKVIAEIFSNVGTIASPVIGVSVGSPTNNENEFSDLAVSPTVPGVTPRPLPYIIRYTAIDACGNATTATGLLAVMDITAPVAICPPTMKVSLTEDGSAIITAKEIDRGSYDNCTGIAKMEVRRMGPLNGCSGKDVNKDGDYDDYLLQANSNVSFELPDVFFQTEEAAPFAGVYPNVLSPYVALARVGALSVVDNFNNGILERKIFKNVAAWVVGQPDPVGFPTLYITGANTVIFNSFGFTLTFDPITNELLNVVPTTVFLPQFAPPAPFTTRALNSKGSYQVDPDFSDIYGDYNINGVASDEDYYEYNYYNFYHPEVKLCCEDAGDTIMVAMRIWDNSIYKHATNNVNVNHSYYRVGYPRAATVRGNVNICMVSVIVEDKLAPKIVVQDTAVICGTTPQATAWLDAHAPVEGSYNATMSDKNLYSNNAAVAIAAGGNVSIPLQVSGLKSVKDLNVALKFYHTDLSNLTATITSPSGKSAILFATPVDTKSKNYNTTAINSAATLFRFTFDDEPTLSASTAIQLQAIPGVPNVITSANLNLINGNYLGNDPLTIFDGEDANGTWIIDLVSSDPSSAGAGAIIAGGAQLWIKADRTVMPQGYFYDNCPGYCVTYTDAGAIDNCGKGTVTRTYTIKDMSGKTATDIAEYTSTNRSAYKVEFPADVTITCNNNKVYATAATAVSAGGAGIPTVTPYAKTCPLVGTEFVDDTLVVNGLDNSCFKILRKWKVLNWCQPLNLNPNRVQQANPASCGSLVPRTFINIDYSAWAGMSPSAVNAALGECTGITYDQDGYMEYIQVIKVIDNTPPTWVTVGTPSASAVGKECKTLLSIPASDAQDCTGKVTYSYEIVRASDNVVVATGGASGSKEFTSAEFGAYIIRYRASDNCGNLVTSDKAIAITDAKKPTPVCFQGLSVDLMPTTGNVMIAANLLNAGSYDNCTLEGVWIQTPAPGPGHSITEYTVLTSADPNVNMTTIATPKTIAKNVQFACVGYQTVALWAKDAAGNWDYCETYVDVQNNMGAPNVPNCNVAPPVGGKIASTIMTEKSKEVENVMVKLTGAVTNQKYTDLAGKLEFLGLKKTETYTVKPELDKEPLNGVSTLDLVLISKHILGVQPLSSAYQLIAADVNHNGTVTTADIVELRKMILAVQTGFSKNTSWRFVDKAYQFPANNPLAVAFPESKQYTGINDTENAEFVAVKVGDVNGNAKTNGQAVGRGAVGTFFFNADEQSFNAGDEVRATFKADEIANVLGYQFTLGYNKSALDLLNIEGQTENFAVIEAGTITTSWNGNGEGLFTVVFKAKKSGTLSEMLNINSRYTAAEAYTKGAEMLNVAIKYNNSTSKMELYQNQPNPFVGRTVIGFNLTKAENAKLSIHDATGRLLKVVEKDFAKGYNEVAIDDVQAVGVLRYTLSTASETATKSMIILE